MLIKKDGKRERNSFYYKVFLKNLFGKVVDEELPRKLKLDRKKKCKRAIPTHCKFMDL